MNDPTFDLATTPLHLGLGATVVEQPPFTGEMSWYQGYGERHGKDGAEGRLVTIHSFAESWTSWEMHPEGEELVLCLEGEVTLVQEVDGAERKVTLTPHRAVVNPRGVWHTADVVTPCTCLFITAGIGTEHRER